MSIISCFKYIISDEFSFSYFWTVISYSLFSCPSCFSPLTGSAFHHQQHVFKERKQENSSVSPTWVMISCQEFFFFILWWICLPPATHSIALNSFYFQSPFFSFSLLAVSFGIQYHWAQVSTHPPFLSPHCFWFLPCLCFVVFHSIRCSEFFGKRTK